MEIYKQLEGLTLKVEKMVLLVDEIFEELRKL
jgi:hypothetical protein